MAVPVSTEPNFTPGQPQQLSALDSFPPARAPSGAAQYDVFPDSQRFVTIAPVDDGNEEDTTAAPSVRIVENWYEEFCNRDQ
jgi:hypothetical protein